MYKNILGIILARGGSKGVPRKNIKLLAGKPLIAWTIIEAKKSRFINRLILTTDDYEIAEIAKNYGCEVPFMRPKELAEDLTPDLPVIKHVLERLKEESYVPDIIAHLRPTAPLRKAEDIDKGIEIIMNNENADSVRSVIKTPKHPLKMWFMEGGKLGPIITHDKLSEAYNLPRQIINKEMPVFAQNNSVDIIRAKTILEKQSMTGDNIYGFEMPEDRSVDIDTPEDFLKIEQLMQ